MLRLLIGCIWILMLAVLMLADQGGDSESGGSRLIELLKIASRLSAIGIVTTVLWCSREKIVQSSLTARFLPWALFAAWAVFSIAWSALRSTSLSQSLSLVILLMLSCCIAIQTRRIAHVSQILMHLCLAMLVISTVVLAARFVAPDTFSLSRNAKGSFHPTNAAATAGLAIVVITVSTLLFNWRWARWLIAPSLLVHGATLVLANNRASLMVTTIVIVFAVLWGAAPQARWLLVTCGCLALAGYLVADPALRGAGGVSDRLAAYLAREQSTQELAALSGREEMWTVMWKSFQGSPWIGHGYFVSSATGQLKVWYVWSNWTAHNFWLQILVGTGIVGAGLMALGLLSYIVQLVRAWSLPTGSHNVACLGALVLLWQCGWGLTNESFAGPLQAESIAFFAVLGLVIGRIVHAEARANERGEAAYSPLGSPAFRHVLATESI